MKKNLMLCALLLSVLLSGCAAEPLQGQAAANTTEAPTLQEGTPDSFEPVSTEPNAPTEAPTEGPTKEPSVPAITEPEPTPETEPVFDIEHWISYAKSTAVSLGLTLDSSATDCWDNPITAKPTCIYLERDINSRLNRYAKEETITAVWIWYECVGTSSYLIYIGYA